nr:EOG090X0FQ8 [Ilyocryptus agilis]
MNEADGTSAEKPLRDDLVSTAVKFLQNPRVATRPDSEKEIFLQKKGLTQAEIKAAFDASGISSNMVRDDSVAGRYSSVKVAQVHQYHGPLAPILPKSKWAIVRDLLNAIALVAGAAYGLRYLYRRFLGPLLFGRKEKTLAESVQEMNNNLTRLIGDVSHAVENLAVTVATLQAKQNEKSEMKELKSEVASLKALLLSRRQFPAPPAILTSGPPSIPSWQMGASSGEEKMDLRRNQSDSSQQLQLGATNEVVSLSSSPEIISVDEMPSHPIPNVTESHSGSSARDPSESSESNSAEMVEMGASASGGSGEDTD